MRAVFIQTNCILRDSRIDPAAPEASWRLTPATLEALRRLSGPEQLLLLMDAAEPEHAEAGGGLSAVQSELVRQVEAGGGRVDALINCPHSAENACHCWDNRPAMLLLPAAQFALDLAACFVIADQERTITAAYAAGVRPLVILDGRQIVDVLGLSPAHKDFPIAPDLTTAVSYITVEQEISLNLGHQRAPQPVLPRDAEAAWLPDQPTITVTSARLAALRNKQIESRIKLKDLARWLSFLIIGSLGVTLGIAYLLTHLYRVQHFPEFIYWLTLQFIPRPLRGALFILIGGAVIWLAVRGFYRSDVITRLRRLVRGK